MIVKKIQESITPIRWDLKKKHLTKTTYLPLFVIIISVPIWWNWLHRSAFCNFTDTPGNPWDSPYLGDICICRGAGTGSIVGYGSESERFMKNVTRKFTCGVLHIDRNILTRSQIHVNRRNDEIINTSRKYKNLNKH